MIVPPWVAELVTKKFAAVEAVQHGKVILTAELSVSNGAIGSAKIRALIEDEHRPPR